VVVVLVARPAIAQGGGGVPRADTAHADTLHALPDTGAAADSAFLSHTDTAAIRARRDSIHADSIQLIRARYHPDTVTRRAPFAHAEVPALLDVGQSYRWTRKEIDASGALTLGDLLDQIPGVTGFRSGWISSPQVSAYNGDVSRIRVFYDGIELDPLDARLKNVPDLSTIQIATLDEVAVERGPNELRVYCRSWSVDKVTPYTEADVLTGTSSTNLYRAYFGGRLKNGLGIQVAATQYNNTGPFGGGGQNTTLFGRFGWSNGTWSFDAVGDRYQRGRDATVVAAPDPFEPIPTQTTLPDLESTRTDAYLRAAYGDPDHGLWAQVVASTMTFKNTSVIATGNFADTTVIAPGDTVVTDTGAVPAVDSVISESQYIASAGITKWGIRFSGTDRLRIYGTRGAFNSPSGRASFDWPFLSASLFVERNAPTAQVVSPTSSSQPTVPLNTEELAVRLTPLPFIELIAAGSRQSSNGSIGAPPTSTTLRGEAGIRLAGLWFSGGVTTIDTQVVAAPTVYDSAFAPAGIGRSTGYFGAVRGQLWRAFSVDLWGIHWQQADPYRPQDQARGALTFETEWLSRFPKHTFNIKMQTGFEYRSGTTFPTIASLGQPTYATHIGEDIFALLEIRVLQGTLTYQIRNATGYNYWTVPGYLMPRTINIYGLRWSFWN
jgi:hypothetical protein